MVTPARRGGVPAPPLLHRSPILGKGDPPLWAHPRGAAGAHASEGHGGASVQVCRGVAAQRVHVEQSLVYGRGTNRCHRADDLPPFESPPNRRLRTPGWGPTARSRGPLLPLTQRPRPHLQRKISRTRQTPLVVTFWTASRRPASELPHRLGARAPTRASVVVAGARTIRAMDVIGLEIHADSDDARRLARCIVRRITGDPEADPPRLDPGPAGPFRVLVDTGSDDSWGFAERPPAVASLTDPLTGRCRMRDPLGEIPHGERSGRRGSNPY